MHDLLSSKGKWNDERLFALRSFSAPFKGPNSETYSSSIHDAGWLHGDLRFCNLTLDANGSPHIFDFSHSSRVRERRDYSVRESVHFKRLLASQNTVL
jgi:serine/threonine protein kinase